MLGRNLASQISILVELKSIFIACIWVKPIYINDFEASYGVHILANWRKIRIYLSSSFVAFSFIYLLKSLKTLLRCTHALLKNDML